MYLNLPLNQNEESVISYSIIVGNKNMDSPFGFTNYNYIYGTDYLYYALNKETLNEIRAESPTNTGIQKLRLGRTRVKASNTQGMCDETNSAANPFKCASKFLEVTTGCSLGVSVNMPRFCLA